MARQSFAWLVNDLQLLTQCDLNLEFGNIVACRGGVKNKRDESAYWETIFDQVARESDPQMLHKYLDRLIQALHARKEELHTVDERGRTAVQPVQEDEGEKSR